MNAFNISMKLAVFYEMLMSQILDEDTCNKKSIVTMRKLLNLLSVSNQFDLLNSVCETKSSNKSNLNLMNKKYISEIQGFCGCSYPILNRKKAVFHQKKVKDKAILKLSANTVPFHYNWSICRHFNKKRLNYFLWL